MGKKHFAGLEEFPEARAFWWPRFVRIASWFVEQERERRAVGIKNIKAEAQGMLTLGDFTLKGRADRIDRLADGTLAIIDYTDDCATPGLTVSASLAARLKG